MRRGFFLLIAVLCAAGASAQIPAGYYDKAQGQKGENLRKALHDCIVNHEELNYDALELYYGPTDFRPDGTLWDIYSTCEYEMSDAGGTQDDFCQHWNKEHTVCQSWFGGGSPMYSDIFHVLPTDARVNNLRSNYAYGETNVRNDKVTLGAPYALGHLGTSTTIGDIVYQPDDRYKGDIARIYFYMATCYMNKDFTQADGGRTMFTYDKSKTLANLSGYSINLLMKWHRNDPVSYKEIARNDSVYKQQGNRNPFVDYPDLAEYIWGNKTESSFNAGTLLSAYSSEYAPLDTEGSDRTDYDKFGVTWYACGQKIQTDSVFKNHRPVLPTAPLSCSASSNVFMGWSGSAIAGKTQTAPADLFDNTLDAPTISADRTFYAVFAHKEQGVGMGSVTQTASFTEADGYKYSSKTEIKSAEAGKVHIAFAKANASTYTKFFYELRCYAGSTITLSGATITRVEFVPGKNDGGNAITAKTGTMNGLVWTGSASSIVFTIGGDKSYRGLSAIIVTYDDNTTVFVYSDYLTQCGGATGVESIQPSAFSIQKVLRDGQLYIIRGDRTYTIQGELVR